MKQPRMRTRNLATTAKHETKTESFKFLDHAPRTQSANDTAATEWQTAFETLAKSRAAEIRRALLCDSEEIARAFYNTALAALEADLPLE